MNEGGDNPDAPQASEVIRTAAARPARETRAARPLAPWPEWLSLRQLTEYCGVSERTARSWIHTSGDPLPAVQVRGKILVKRSELDRWLEQHVVKTVDLSGIVDGIMEAVTDGR